MEAICNSQLTIGGTVLNLPFLSQSAADFLIDGAKPINKIIRDATEVILPASNLDIARMQLENNLEYL